MARGAIDRAAPAMSESGTGELGEPATEVLHDRAQRVGIVELALGDAAERSERPPASPEHDPPVDAHLGVVNHEARIPEQFTVCPLELRDPVPERLGGNDMAPDRDDRPTKLTKSRRPRSGREDNPVCRHGAGWNPYDGGVPSVEPDHRGRLVDLNPELDRRPAEPAHQESRLDRCGVGLSCAAE